MPTNDLNLPFKDKIIESKKLLKKQITDLPQRFAQLTQLIESEIQQIEQERAQGIEPIPELEFADLKNTSVEQIQKIKRRGCLVIRNVFDRKKVEAWNDDIVEYLASNHYLEKSVAKRGIDQYFSTLASSKPQIYGIYWSKSQMQARQSPELAEARKWLNRLWKYEHEGKAVFNPDLECLYADRVRQRQPGDASLGLSAHCDAGSIERWIDGPFREVYREIFKGDVTKYDAFDAAFRTETNEIPSPAVSSVFRTFQGWTALTPQGAGDGTLNIIPTVLAVPYMLLRALQDDVAEDDLCNAQAGRAMVVSKDHHELLLRAYGPIPKVYPGDTVWWHPDVLHGVEDVHRGTGYSNVIYIGAAPSCDKNNRFLELQKTAFEEGLSSPDFAPENYEVDFKNRFTVEELTPLGRQQMGYK